MFHYCNLTIATMHLYQLHTRQLLPISLDEAWNFFSRPENLSKITPQEMNFKILSGAGVKTFPGQIIHYKVSPLAGISMYWTTEITQCVEKEYFIDEQRSGPYRFWHHRHQFTEQAGGTLMEDVLHYALPMGPLGRIAHAVLVRSKLESIFRYREQKLDELFGAKSSATAQLDMKDLASAL